MSLLDRERRIADLGARVLTAVGERDEVVTGLEREAGDALVSMVDVEGMSTAELAAWFGDELDATELTRLRRVASEPTADGQDARAGR